MSWDERVYKLLIRAYPRAFRGEYEDQLLEMFRYRRAQGEAAGGFLWRIRFWRAIGQDLIKSAVLDRRPRTEDRKRGGGEMGIVWQDFRQAGRRLLKTPGFTAAAILILCAGIGVNVAAFGVVNALLFQPPPFEEPHRLAELLQDSDGGGPNSTSYPAFQDIRDHEALFSSVAARAGSDGTLMLDDALVPIAIEYATATYLEVLGLAPGRGRWFEQEEDFLEGPPVAVVSHRMWSSRLAMDPEILGRQLRIDGTNVTVVGVGPEQYSGGVGPAVGDLWLSISAMDDVGGPAQSLERREDHPFRVIARLMPGVQFPDVVAGMDRLSSRLAQEFPEINRNRRIHVLPVTAVGAEQQGRFVPGALLLMGVVGLVLLVATINLTNLLLVRSAARRKEIAVRLALGGSRSRLIRVLLSESIVLTAVGGALGFLLADLGLKYLRGVQLNFGVPLTLDVRMDMRVFAFALLVSGVTVLLAGLLPALRSTRTSTVARLNDKIGGSLRRKHGVTGVLVATQMAASLLLLFTAGLFTQSLLKARVADPGFNTEGLALVRTDLRQLELSEDGLRTAYADLEERIEALPGVVEVTTAFQAPVAQQRTTTLLVNDDVDGGLRPVEVPWDLVGNDYFATLGVPLLHGRVFGERDGPSEPTMIVVNEAMARAFWGRTDVVGEMIARESEPESPREVIGVVGNVKV
ncbi:MAG: ABC transporter permease, partial [Longimicrobiales bacterium]